jgi:transcriptional regulator with XRE-family HTH domain
MLATDMNKNTNKQMTLPEFFKVVRIERGLSQRAMSEALGLSPSVAGLIEQGQMPISKEIERRLGRMLTLSEKQRYCEIASQEIMSNLLGQADRDPEAKLKAISTKKKA